MLRMTIALVLVAHGVGHSLGLLQLLRIATVNPGWQGDSWLIGSLGTGVTQAVGACLWALAIVGFAALAAIVAGWLPITWFRPVAIGAAAVSLAGLAVFPTAFPATSSIGALAVDIAVLVGVVVMRWDPSGLTT